MKLGILQLKVATLEIVYNCDHLALLLEGLAGGRAPRKSVYFVDPWSGSKRLRWCVNHIYPLKVRLYVAP